MPNILMFLIVLLILYVLLGFIGFAIISLFYITLLAIVGGVVGRFLFGQGKELMGMSAGVVLGVIWILSGLFS
ncbi:MAG: hypothetical protein ACNI27_08760 [Desulfovibrio sp.]